MAPLGWICLLCTLDRVYGKGGCFVPSSLVTMADGSRRQIQHVKVGDLVQSWDEENERPALSTVKAVPAFERFKRELVEIQLANTSILATEDHPFWSHTRGILVSNHPEATSREYGLNASRMLESEVLHGDDHAPLPIIGLSRLPANFRSLRAGDSTSAGMTQVMTLCLHPHHWYFAEGARVHNKGGCFVPSSEVTMADGSRQQIQHIKVGDRVQSWDEDNGRPAVSTVKAVPSFERLKRELVEIKLQNTSILATEDHPFWSHARGVLVSNHPEATSREYGLNASRMLESEMLHGDDQAPVPITGLSRLPANLRSLRAGDSGTAGMTPVMTLCLHPHHWYYAQGVRVHNKGGCFVPSSKVTMADGSRKRIGDVQVGQQVQSWDEWRQQTAPARVNEVLEFERDEDALVNISFGGASVAATSDHPFWSRSRGALVSFDPEETRKKCDLLALQMRAGEVLEDEFQQPVNVTSIQRARLQDTCHSEEEARRIRTKADVAKVMTLKLEEHHWFYVEGVRVHNKGSSGCFAPWTSILMPAGLEKPIGEIRVRDRVLSWDEAAGRLVEATVLGIDIVPADPDFLVEINWETSQETCESKKGVPMICAAKASGWQNTSRSLVLTKDHPIFSKRSGGLVSMAPNITQERYALQVGQMACEEVFHHHEGYSVKARVGSWTGSRSVPYVMTLRLDKHHWFFAEGIRVHNKGGSGGGRVSRSSFTSNRAFIVGAVIISSRRRYGTYHDEGGCTMSSNYESICTSTIAWNSGSDSWSWSSSEQNANCSGLLAANSPDCCHQCMEFEEENQIDSIAGCESFLAQVHESCDEGETNTVAYALGITGAVVVLLCVCCFCFMRSTSSGKDEEKTKELEKKYNQKMLGPGDIGTLPSVLVLNGSYEEEGTVAQCSYTFELREDGSFTGRQQDADGQAEFKGKVHVQQSFIFWLETQLEGPIVCFMEGSIVVQDSVVRINVGYESDHLVTGNLTLQGSLEPGNVVAATPVVIGTVINVGAAKIEDDKANALGTNFRQSSPTPALLA
eukprot:TRINITY_DN11225_c0_g8_i1.p1 TRINITY_DN11225_c0_g8~~TRINITY_DN11225_c0_g8_i1.p1  ORF type:complete len:1028 (-),score=143.93 TRINITY_DN11225_c0_g8_i1:113-3196(-)